MAQRVTDEPLQEEPDEITGSAEQGPSSSRAHGVGAAKGKGTETSLEKQATPDIDVRDFENVWSCRNLLTFGMSEKCFPVQLDNF